MKRKLLAYVSIILMFSYTTSMGGFPQGVGGGTTTQVKAKEMTKYNLVPGKYEKKEIKKTKEKKNYIICAESNEQAEKLEKTYTPVDIVAEGDRSVIEDNNGFVANLSYEEAKSLQNEKGVLLVEEDTYVEANGKTDSEEEQKFDAEWNKKIIHAGKKRDESLAKIKIGIIDSGVDEFNDIDVKENVNFIPGDEEILPLFWDTKGHGSAIAGIIAAEENDYGITGIASNVEIYSARVLDHNNIAPVSRIVEGIYWAIENDVDIISMSFGTSTDSQILHSALQRAAQEGILLVAAAGNEGQVEYPAAYDEVIAVGAVDSSSEISSNSATGKEIELVAPGEKVKSTGAFHGTVVCSGTSIAVPHVVGVAARLWGKDRTVSADFIRGLLKKSANKYKKAEGYGNGLIDEEYADEIYSQYKTCYSEDKSESLVDEVIEDNEIIPQDYINTNVEGRWTGDTHADIVASIANVEYIKYGAIYPDQDASGKKGMTDHPAWHGYYTSSSGANVNYISTYIYMTRLANYVRSGYDTSKLSSTYDSKYNSEFYSYVNNMDWRNIMMQDDSLSNRGCFVIGLALHNITDIFAHSVWAKKPGSSSFERIKHNYDFRAEKKGEPKNADNTKVYEERYFAALGIAQRCLNRYFAGQSGQASDFAFSYTNAGVTWKVKYLSDYAKTERCGSSAFATLYSYTQTPQSNSYSYK